MKWTTPYVAYRVSKINEKNSLIDEIYHGSDIKAANRWMKFISQQWDVMCKTPLHPKHSKGSEKAEYYSHKVGSGDVAQDEKGWSEYAKSLNFDLSFPAEQMFSATELEARQKTR